MIKFHFVFDRTRKAILLKKNLLKKYKSHSITKSSHIIIGGGDGFMLHNLKKYYKYNLPFYGINCGTYGFLLNKYESKNLNIKIKNSKKITINPLGLTCVDKKKIIKKSIAINEVSLFRQSRQTTSLNLKVGKINVIKKLIGDGILICTPAGSTAYNLSVHGPILSLNSGKIAITPISPFRPRRWKGKIVSNNKSIKILNLDTNKRPVAAASDNQEFRNIKSLTIKVNKEIKIDLLFDKNRSLIKKIKIEQAIKNIR